MALRQPNVLPGFGLTFGFTTFFLSALVLLPLAALVLMAASMNWHDFVHVVFSPRALGSYRLTPSSTCHSRCLQRCQVLP
jgi:sulfate/thiosulfate transport system permease protein